MNLVTAVILGAALLCGVVAYGLRQRGLDWDQIAALPLGALVLGGAIAFGLWVASRSAREQRDFANDLRNAFGMLAQWTGLELLPGVAGDASTPPSFPILRGTYGGRRAHIHYSYDLEYVLENGVTITLFCHDGRRWPNAGSLDPKHLPPALPVSTQAPLAALADPSRRPQQVVGLRLSGTEFTGVARYNGPKLAPGQSGVDAADLKRILDVLLSVANALPTTTTPSWGPPGQRLQ